ncbi:hydrolase [bacterium]|nr:hydrolase [candidate division CSSED10-310 bacterium]
MMTRNSAILAVIDVQQKLIGHIHEHEKVVKTIVTLIRGMKILDIPILWLEQYPEGLGKTVPEIAEQLNQDSPITKLTFSGGRNADFIARLEESKRRDVILCGIETHVCVYQTAADLLQQGYRVEVVTDAVSSRTLRNSETGLAKMKSLGAGWTSLETALFELLETAEGDAFRKILRLVK